MFVFTLIVFLVLMIVALVIVLLVMLNHRNRPPAQYNWPLPGQQQPPALPPGPTGKTTHCCREDGPCSARCGQLDIAQTMLAASDGVRHHEHLQPLIKLLHKVDPGRLNNLLDAEEAAPGTLDQVLATLEAGDPSLGHPNRSSKGRRTPAA
jgi:hypothetical protein